MKRPIVKILAFALALTLCLTGCSSPKPDSGSIIFESTHSAPTVSQNKKEPSASDINGVTHVDLTLSDKHHIQADVEGGQYTQLAPFALEPISISVEEAFGIFAPEDTEPYTVQKTEEGTRLISQKGNYCYVSPYRIIFEKENETQKKINNELLHLLELYAEENLETSWQELDFIDQAGAVQMVEELLKKIGLNFEPKLQASAAMPIQAIMDYQQELLERDQASEYKFYDPFGKAFLLENLDKTNDACFLSFAFAYQGIPVYKGTPTVSYTDGVFPPTPVTLSVLLTRQGLQIFDGQALSHVGQENRSGDILSVNEAVELYRQKYDSVIRPEGNAMRVSSIYLEYIPAVIETGTILTPYWCFPIEMDFPVGWREVDSERFNAFNGEDITYHQAIQIGKTHTE